MIQLIAYYSLLGKPLIFYAGIVTYLLFASAALVGIFIRRGIFVVPFRWHMRIAIAALISASIHALMGLSAYFNF